MFSVVRFLDIFYQLLMLVIFVRIIMSWFRPSPNALARFVANIADPILNFFRHPRLVIGMIDLSPVVALIILDLLYKLVRDLLITL